MKHFKGLILVLVIAIGREGTNNPVNKQKKKKKKR